MQCFDSTGCCAEASHPAVEDGRAASATADGLPCACRTSLLTVFWMVLYRAPSASRSSLAAISSIGTRSGSPFITAVMASAVPSPTLACLRRTCSVQISRLATLMAPGFAVSQGRLLTLSCSPALLACILVAASMLSASMLADAVAASLIALLMLCMVWLISAEAAVSPLLALSAFAVGTALV